MEKVIIINKPEISAIYYALLQSNYNFYIIDKDQGLIKEIEGFIKEKCDFDTSFFSKTRQDTCKVYPYWPRAFALEKATFHICTQSWSFKDFNSYLDDIMKAPNITDYERDKDFWDWISDFPNALNNVMMSKGFSEYLKWEDIWISKQNKLWGRSLQLVQKLLDTCKKRYNSTLTKINIILTPIKCSYSSDYIINKDEIHFILGSYRDESIVHEYLHHVVNPLILKYKALIINHKVNYPGIDSSYYLARDVKGKLNAFEEYIVRLLTSDILKMEFPSSLDEYIKKKLAQLQ